MNVIRYDIVAQWAIDKDRREWASTVSAFTRKHGRYIPPTGLRECQRVAKRFLPRSADPFFVQHVAVAILRAGHA
jgi:hypothetical protein